MFSRKVWQHDIQRQSEDQFTELIHSIGWEISKIPDYGEDFFIRPFHEGNPTGDAFLVQLKGTPNIKQYQRQDSHFSYPIEVINLQQWKKFLLPVLLVLWDTQNRQGYWVHVQPFIEKMLQENSDWLKKLRGKRQVYISSESLFSINRNTAFETPIRDLFSEIRQQQNQKIDMRKVHLVKELFATPNVEQLMVLTALEAILTKKPSDSAAWLEKANIHYDLRELDKAIFAINKAGELQPSNLNIMWAKACILAEYAIANQGEPKAMLYEAIELFQSAGEIADPALLNYNIGNSYTGLREHKQAVEYYDRALSGTLPSGLAAQVWKNRGTSCFHLGDNQEEIRCYQKAIELDPNLWEAYTSWAVTEAHLENYEHARVFFLKALKIKPELADSRYFVEQLYTFVHTLSQLNLFGEAYEWASHILSLMPNHHNALLAKAYALAHLWRESEEYAPEALKTYRAILIDMPNSIFARGELFLLYNFLGRKSEARQIIEETIQQEDVPSRVFYDYGLFLEKEGDIHKAIEQVEKAFEKSQEHHIVHTLGRLKYKVGSYEDAIKYYNLALEGVSDLTELLEDIADCHYHLGEFKEAVRITVELLFIQPNNEIWLNNLLYALVRLGHITFHLELSEMLEGLKTENQSDIETTRENIRKFVTSSLNTIR